MFAVVLFRSDVTVANDAVFVVVDAVVADVANVGAGGVLIRVGLVA